MGLKGAFGKRGFDVDIVELQSRLNGVAQEAHDSLADGKVIVFCHHHFRMEPGQKRRAIKGDNTEIAGYPQAMNALGRLDQHRLHVA